MEANQSLSTVPVRFKNAQKGMFMKTIRSNSALITVIINKNKLPGELSLDFGTKKVKGHLIYANMTGKIYANKIHLSPGETMVIEWK
jgi:hypothetical protein